MQKDCSIYENCLQDMTVEINVEKNNITLLAVGCWGVYCHTGEHTKKEKKVFRGQGIVSNALIEYKKHNDTEDMFLVGDNIYEDEKGEYDMEKQLNKGFENCFRKSGISRFFLAVGNHDIENCDILSKQYKYKGWNFPSLYYNVLYKLQDYIVNIIILDTNMFEENPKKCNNTPFTQEQIDAQCTWAKTVSKQGYWNIVMGHIPYLANGHKESKHPVQRKKLKTLIDEIKPDLYICADEHNQQFIQIDKETPIVVIGSGGTALDKTLDKSILGTEYWKSIFGFISLEIKKEYLNVSFINTDIRKEFSKNILKNI